MSIPIDADPGIGDMPPGTGGGGGGGGGTPTAAGVTIFDQNVTKDVADSDWRILTYLNVSSTDDIQCRAFIIVDGVVEQIGDINMTFSEANSNARTTLTIPTYISGLAAGVHRVVVSVSNHEASGDLLTVRAAAILEITELKHSAK